MRHRLGMVALAVVLILAGAIGRDVLWPPVEAQTFPIRRVTAASAVLTAGTNTTSTTIEVLRAALVAWECLVQNDPDNTVDVLVGSAAATTIQLAPGQSITLPIADANTINISSVSGTPVVNFLCR